MSVQQAQEFLKRLIEDDEFRARLESLPVNGRRQVLIEEGYGDIQLEHLDGALPTHMGGELTDEEFNAVAGGGATKTAVSMIVPTTLFVAAALA